MNKYSLVLDQNGGEHLKSYDELAEETFGINFSAWREKGYKGGKNTPYSLVDGDTVAANASANLMSFSVGNKIIKAVQIGTVMTKKSYRGQGLSRILIDRIIADYEDNCDFIYLFANKSVLDFYPKFGFIKTSEYESQYTYKQKLGKFTPHKLNMDNNEDYKLFTRLVNNNKPSFKISMLDNFGLIMFYCAFSMKDSIYYIPELELAVVATLSDSELCIHDIFCEKDYNLDDVVNSLLNSPAAKVTLGFTPLNADNVSLKIKGDDDNTLFIRAKDHDIIIKLMKLDEAMFPEFSHA